MSLPAPPPDPAGLPVITVVGLGPAGPELVTAGALEALAAHPLPHRFLRTARHPAARLLAGSPTFDAVYEQSVRIDDVYTRIVEELVAAAGRHRRILYAVPGSPVVAERTVELLRADDRVHLVLQPALSFLDLTWSRLGIDPVAAGVRVVDGHRFAVEAAGERGPLLVGQCDSTDVLSDVKLAIGEALDMGASGERERSASAGERERSASAGPVVTVLQRLGLPDEAVAEVRWDDLDRVVSPDHLTSLYIPAHAPPVAREVQRFAELVATLRRECPWDRAQTHDSLKRHLLEESYEVLDAIDHLDGDAGYDHLEEELGDLLFQVLFHATLAAEEGQFTLADVARRVHDKLRSRHPHVFGDVVASDAEQVAANWEELKQREKGRSSVFEGIPAALPALLLAAKVRKRAASLRKGAAPEREPVDELAAAVGRLRSAPAPDADAVGELLWAAVAVAEQAGVDPETALRSATATHRATWEALERDAAGS
jgi:tetrapyrrole methylase family protein/MazG family protein